MLLDDSLQNRRIALAIPRAFRVDDGNRSGLADTEAVRLRAENAVVRQPKLDQAPLQVIPRHDRSLAIAAFRLGLVAAEEDVAPRDPDAQLLDDGVFALGHGAIMHP